MTEVFFYFTESMIIAGNVFSEFSIRRNGRRARVVFEDDDSSHVEKLVGLLESFGCALQIETDATDVDDEDLIRIFREYGCAT